VRSRPVSRDLGGIAGSASVNICRAQAGSRQRQRRLVQLIGGHQRQHRVVVLVLLDGGDVYAVQAQEHRGPCPWLSLAIILVSATRMITERHGFLASIKTLIYTATGSRPAQHGQLRRARKPPHRATAPAHQSHAPGT